MTFDPAAYEQTVKEEWDADLMKGKIGPMRVGFELEVMFSADGYPELLKAAETHGFHWEDNDGEAPHFMRRVIANDLEAYVGSKVSAPKREGSNPSSRWTVKQEYDVEPGAYERTLCAVEIITPPMEVEDAKIKLSSVFDFCLDHGGFTDHQCGLHMTFDLRDRNSSSLAKIALLLDERELLSRFDRDCHGGAIPQLDRLIVEAAVATIDGNEFALDDAYLEHSLGEGKQFAINFEKVWRYGVVEFRHCGGPGILDDVEKLSDVVDEIAEAMSRAESFDGHNLLGAMIEDDVIGTLGFIDRLELEARPAEFVGIKEYHVTFDDRHVGSICQLSAADFTFLGIRDIPGFTALVVDSLGKAKALTALSLYKAFGSDA